MNCFGLLSHNACAGYFAIIDQVLHNLLCAIIFFPLTDRCNKLFRFGGGKTLPSTVCVSFPVKVFNTVLQLTVYLIDSDAPLLMPDQRWKNGVLYVISGTNEPSCLMSPNLVGRFCHNRTKDIYCLILWIPKSAPMN